MVVAVVVVVVCEEMKVLEEEGRERKWRGKEELAVQRERGIYIYIERERERERENGRYRYGTTIAENEQQRENTNEKKTYPSRVHLCFSLSCHLSTVCEVSKQREREGERELR